MKTRTDLKKEYKETAIPMGVYLVRNMKTNEFVIGQSRNLTGSLNMYRSVLKWGKATDVLLKNPKILEDYRVQGDESFEFKVLDSLKPKEDAGWDPAEDLNALEKMWMDELIGKDWKPY